MLIRLRQVEVSLEYTDEEIKESAAKKIKCSPTDIVSFFIEKRSLDARPRRVEPAFILQLEIHLKSHVEVNWAHNRDLDEIDPPKEVEEVTFPKFKEDRKRPIVIGAGPAGLMAAFHLSVMGFNPIVLERGSQAEERQDQVTAFWRGGAFNPESNTLFGEGGAGLFSDGKLTARSKDKPRIRLFLQTLVRCGAPKEILMDSEPHVGSDNLLRIVPNLRRMIEENGGEIKFNSPVTDISIDDGKVSGVSCGFSYYPTDDIILATGHSARDVYRMLSSKGVALESKPSAIGIRLEVPQHQIDSSQYGKFAGHKAMGAANFKLTRKGDDRTRACYSFCMCPGGLTISCASEKDGLTTNGMSYSSRSGFYGNAAFIVPVGPEDYGMYEGPDKAPELAGLNFQAHIEQAAYKAGGNGFSLPALRLQDFLADRVSEDLPEGRSCKRSRPADFRSILPEFIIKTLKKTIPPMLRQLKSVDQAEAIMYAAETRSSSTVRILRDDTGQSPNVLGLYPTGEGSGYAGGIVSSAVDGLKAAETLVEKYKY